LERFNNAKIGEVGRKSYYLVTTLTVLWNGLFFESMFEHNGNPKSAVKVKLPSPDPDIWTDLSIERRRSEFAG
jgi:hypothetical protein